MYQYRAVARRVIDGDTAEFDVDLGFGVWQRAICRLRGINTPELSKPGGKDARAALLSLILGKTLEVVTVKDRTEKYGRMLVVILMDDGVTTVNDWLVEHGYAVPYMV